jgi:hypothetical protein
MNELNFRNKAKYFFSSVVYEHGKTILKHFPGFLLFQGCRIKILSLLSCSYTVLCLLYLYVSKLIEYETWKI